MAVITPRLLRRGSGRAASPIRRQLAREGEEREAITPAVRVIVRAAMFIITATSTNTYWSDSPTEWMMAGGRQG